VSLEVRESADGRRFELWEDGELAGYADTVVIGAQMSVPHTEVEPARTGRGLAAVLVREVLDTARSRGQQVLPQCPYVSAWIARHPDYLDLVPPDRRRAYRLPAADASPAARG
jgi:predicted GNAT family acetyltransferase